MQILIFYSEPYYQALPLALALLYQLLSIRIVHPIPFLYTLNHLLSQHDPLYY